MSKSVETVGVLAGRSLSSSSGLAGLRFGAALVLALAAAAMTPAFAQSAPEPADAKAASGDDASLDDDQKSAQTANGEKRLKPGEKADKVFVFGRKVESTIATLPDPREAPQVVNVITAQTLREQGVTSLEQALRNVPGITTQIGEGGTMNGDQFFIRGFAAKDDIYTDGLRDFGVFTRDSFNYGEVEVLKGPSSTLLGRGTTGGGINTSSKIPFLSDGGNVTAAGGSAEYQRATLDWNKKLTDDMAVRFNAMVHHQEVEGRDFIKSDRYGIAPSIGFGLGGKTSLTIAALYQRDDRVPDYGIPTVSISSPTASEPLRTVSVPYTRMGVKSTNFYGYDADVDHTKVFTVTAKLKHEVNDWLTLTSDTKFGDYWRYFRQTVPNACVDTLTSAPTGVTRCATFFTDNNPATIPTVAIGGPGPYDQTTLGVQNVSVANITAPIAGFRNEGQIGWDVSWQTNDRDQFNYYPAGDARTRQPKNVFDPLHSPSPLLTAVKNNKRESDAKDVAFFVSDRFWFTPQWSIKAGLRAEWYEFDQDQTNFVASTTNPDVLASTNFAPLSSNSQFNSPSLAVIWEPSPEMTFYASYATSATPPGITVSNGSAIAAPTTGNTLSAKDLDPEKNTSYEIGAKAELIEKVLLVQAAIFDVKKNNAKETDPLSNAIISSGDSQEAKGFELGLGGNITATWGYNFTYAYTDAKTTASANLGNVGKQVIFVPKNAASLWTTYNFEHLLAGLQIGGGVTYQDRVFLANTGYNPAKPATPTAPAVAATTANFSQAPSYVSLDAMASYAFDRYRLSVNAYNLLDDLYYSQVNGNRVVPAPGRYFVATLGVAF
jgi:catecholate siderophore receptor